MREDRSKTGCSAPLGDIKAKKKKKKTIYFRRYHLSWELHGLAGWWMFEVLRHWVLTSHWVGLRLRLWLTHGSARVRVHFRRAMHRRRLEGLGGLGRVLYH